MTTATRRRDTVRSVREDNLVRLAAILGDDAPEMQALARSLHRADERTCNGYQDGAGNWDEAAEQRAEKRSARLEARARAIAEAHGLELYVQGDPRGWPLALYAQSDLDAYNARNGGPARRIDACYGQVAIGVCCH